LTVFLKVIGKQQEMAPSAGLMAQKVGSSTLGRVHHGAAGVADQRITGKFIRMSLSGVCGYLFSG